MSKITSIVALALCLGATTPALASEGHGHHMEKPAFAFGSPAAISAASRNVAVSMGDMSFSPTALKVKAGETIRFDITNASAIDHDFTLGDAATQAAHRQEMAKAADHGGSAHGHDDPNAVTVMAGERKSLAWTFDRPGAFEFDCNVPGHYEAGMAGTIIVTP